MHRRWYERKCIYLATWSVITSVVILYTQTVIEDMYYEQFPQEQREFVQHPLNQAFSITNNESFILGHAVSEGKEHEDRFHYLIGKQDTESDTEAKTGQQEVNHSVQNLTEKHEYLKLKELPQTLQLPESNTVANVTDKLQVSELQEQITLKNPPEKIRALDLPQESALENVAKGSEAINVTQNKSVLNLTDTRNLEKRVKENALVKLEEQTEVLKTSKGNGTIDISEKSEALDLIEGPAQRKPSEAAEVTKILGHSALKEAVEVEKLNNTAEVLQSVDELKNLGKMGKPVLLTDLSEAEKLKSDQLYKQFGVNVLVSDRISLHRALPDFRDETCKKPGRYKDDLPQTSVIICFYNEPWSILLRNVHSILDRTPDHLLKEIILVDDFSSVPYLKDDLEDYVSRLSKVRIVRTSQREGLIRCKIKGAKEADAPVLTYLDSHCEVTQGWLEPLLDVVAKDRTAVAVPVIVGVSYHTFEVRRVPCESLHIGVFTKALDFVFVDVPPRDKVGRHPCDNIRSPVMCGGLFSIDRSFFEEIGFYDEKLEVWGGEQLELSFKAWMCGGSIMAVPCSQVGHGYRKFNPYFKKEEERIGFYKVKNKARVARVWLDDYADAAFFENGISEADTGDVESQLELRRRLKCNSFEWYVENVYPDIYTPSRAVAMGEIRNLWNDSYCLSTEFIANDMSPRVCLCRVLEKVYKWGLSTLGEIRMDFTCFDYTQGGKLLKKQCHGGQGSQYWTYNLEDRKLRHPATGKCLGLNILRKTLEMFPCGSWRFLKWELENLNVERLKELYS